MLNKEFVAKPRVTLSFIDPMYAQGVSELPPAELWSYEAKLDGYRCLAARHSGGVVLCSRRGNENSAKRIFMQRLITGFL